MSEDKKKANDTFWDRVEEGKFNGWHYDEQEAPAQNDGPRENQVWLDELGQSMEMRPGKPVKRLKKSALEFTFLEGSWSAPQMGASIEKLIKDSGLHIMGNQEPMVGFFTPSEENEENEEDGTVAAALFASHEGHFTVIVSPEVQRQGIARRLIKEYISLAEENGLSEISAEVVNSDLLPMLRDELGFIQSPHGWSKKIGTHFEEPSGFEVEGSEAVLDEPHKRVSTFLNKLAERIDLEDLADIYAFYEAEDEQELENIKAKGLAPNAALQIHLIPEWAKEKVSDSTSSKLTLVFQLPPRKNFLVFPTEAAMMDKLELPEDFDARKPAHQAILTKKIVAQGVRGYIRIDKPEMVLLSKGAVKPKGEFNDMKQMLYVRPNEISTQKSHNPGFFFPNE